MSMVQMIEQLIAIVGESAVLSGDELSTRNSSYWDATPMTAKALVRPRTTAEVSEVLKLCHANDQTVVTQGGLTGTVEGAKAADTDIVLSLERMNLIEEIDTSGRTATVQAGCILQTVQQEIEDKGLLFPLDLGARGSCTIGGNVSTNAGGINVIRYGMMRELVLGLEAVLADGTVLSSMNRMLKNNAGYDLKQLFIGSEGTLGIVTRVVLKLAELPVSANSALVAMDSFQQVTDLLKFVDKALGGHLTSYEVMWDNYYKRVTEPGWHSSPMGRDYKFYVVLEAQGADQQQDNNRFTAIMEQALDQGLIVDAVLPKSKAERDRVWAIREDFEALLEHQPQFIYDVSLPIKEMDTYVRSLEQQLKAQWPDVYFYALGHIGDGNLHFFISPPTDLSENLHDKVNKIVYNPLKDIGGSVSAEHGIGLEKRPYLDCSRNEIEVSLMQLLKRTLDPKNLLNPGKVI